MLLCEARMGGLNTYWGRPAAGKKWRPPCFFPLAATHVFSLCTNIVAHVVQHPHDTSRVALLVETRGSKIADPIPHSACNCYHSLPSGKNCLGVRTQTMIFCLDSKEPSLNNLFTDNFVPPGACGPQKLISLVCGHWPRGPGSTGKARPAARRGWHEPPNEQTHWGSAAICWELLVGGNAGLAGPCPRSGLSPVEVICVLMHGIVLDVPSAGFGNSVGVRTAALPPPHSWAGRCGPTRGRRCTCST